jgi:Flp pilus assembly protein TadG
MMQRNKIRFRSRGGNAMVEFALASSLLIPILLGTFQFGYTFYAYNLLSTQMRSGARFGSMKAFKCADAASITNYKQKVRNVVRYGNPSGTGTLIEPQLTDAQVTVNIKDVSGVDADATHTPNYVVVSTSNYTVNALFTTYNFTDKPSVRMPYLGAYQSTLTETAP